MRARIQIRPAALRDLDRILDIETASFGNDAWDRQLFISALANCSRLFFVARLNGRIAGYGVTCLERGRAELVSIAVFPEARRYGVGDAILRFTAIELTRLGITSWRLMVRIGNEDAIRLYRTFGFQRIRTIRNYYGSGDDAWRMEWRP